LETQRVSLQLELHQELPRVLADRVQLQQVLLNLIMNAVEAMSSVESRERSLLVKSELHGAGDLLITVEDSGPGIDPNAMTKTIGCSPLSGTFIGGPLCRLAIECRRPLRAVLVQRPRAGRREKQ
jgi:nitrogen-specific signal transduction histidine kinase